MKKELALVAMLTLGSASVAAAIPFSDTIDFNDTTFTADDVTKTGTWIYDTPNPQSSTPGDLGYNFAYTYTHTASFAPEAESLNSAYLDVTFTGNRDNSLEAWFIYDQDYLDDTQDTIFFLGFIPIGQDYDWATQTFDLSSMIGGVSGSSWSVAFSVDEHTSGSDESMFLAESTLRGDYNPVPEPGTMMLMGFGLAGLVGYNRRRKN